MEIDAADWAVHRREHFIKEIKQAMRQLDQKDFNDKSDRNNALIFALADQDEVDPYLFRVSKRSRVCVLYDYVLPPIKTAPREAV